jgi:hypothetical protein
VVSRWTQRELERKRIRPRGRWGGAGVTPSSIPERRDEGGGQLDFSNPDAEGGPVLGLSTNTI